MKSLVVSLEPSADSITNFCVVRNSIPTDFILNGAPLLDLISSVVSIRGILRGTPGHPQTALLFDTLSEATIGLGLFAGAIIS